jgi:ribosome-binding factor A
MANPRRTDRVAEAIREEIAIFVREGAKDPRISPLLTITAVEVSRDLRTAKVFISVLGDDAERDATVEGLEAIAPRMRGHIGRVLRLRNAPELLFRLDESIARAARIEQLLQQIKQEPAASATAEGDQPARGGTPGDDEQAG